MLETFLMYETKKTNSKTKIESELTKVPNLFCFVKGPLSDLGVLTQLKSRQAECRMWNIVVGYSSDLEMALTVNPFLEKVRFLVSLRQLLLQSSLFREHDQEFYE